MIGALIGAGVSLASGLYNAYKQKQANDDNIDYSKHQQEETWQREDTAYQRAVNDARTAGLSPLAVSGGSSSGAIVSAQRNATQLDTSNFVNAAQAIDASRQQQKQLKLQTESFEQQVKQQKLENNMRQFEFKAMQEQAKRDYDLRADSQSFVQDYQLKQLAQQIARDDESTRQFNLTFGQNASNVDWEHAFRRMESDRNFTEMAKNNEAHRRNLDASSWRAEYDNNLFEKYGFDSKSSLQDAGLNFGRKFLEDNASKINDILETLENSKPARFINRYYNKYKSNGKSRSTNGKF